MQREHLFLCGNAAQEEKLADSARARLVDNALSGDTSIHSLWVEGAKRNVNIDIASIEDPLGAALAHRVRDLLEIAAYVHAADQTVDRGLDDGSDLGDRWRRRLTLRIAVREPDFWNDTLVREALAEALRFVSDDDYAFEFVSRPRTPGFEQGFLPTSPAKDALAVDAVALFSGGLDSLAGAADLALGSGRHVALVTHRAASKLQPIQDGLVGQLVKRAAQRSRPARVVALPFRVQRMDSDTGREFTQRSRSFVFASLAAVVANAIGLSEIHFFENGPMTFNLPLAAQIIGSRATRTTHPRTLLLYEALFEKVFDRRIAIANPYIWKTKGDIVRSLIDVGAGDLLPASFSCSRVISMENARPHCGVCSQCIDRRLAILASEADSLEPASRYRKDIVVDALSEDERALLVLYLNRAKDVGALTDAQFPTRFGEITNALRGLPGSASDNLVRIANLYRRHSAEVAHACKRAIGLHSEKIATSTVPAHSMLALLVTKAASALPTEATVPQIRVKKKSGAKKTKDVIRVLHLSDLHIEAGDAWQQDVVLSRLSTDGTRSRGVGAFTRPA